MNLKTQLIEQLSTTWPGFEKPQVKHIKPWAEFDSIIKNEQIDLTTVLPERLWFWSDQHFYHTNIIKYCDRPFADVNEMADRLVTNYKEVITDNDVVVWVGDVTFKGDAFMNEILRDLPGYKILVLGNHDFDHGIVRRLDFDEIHSIISINNFIVSHHPWVSVPEGHYHIHGHIHTHNTNNPQHINVSVEQIEYKPRSFDSIMCEIAKREI
jgi:calcineurin-like phosphoesterase family protein